MTIQLTTEEHNYMVESRAAGFSINEAINIPGNDEAYYEELLPSGRKILAIHHYSTDKLTIYAIEDNPQSIEVKKINNLIENNELFRSLLT